MILAYLEETAGPRLAESFLASLRRGLALLSEQPAIGSLRLAEDVGMAGLRIWPVRGFPYVVFYLEQADLIMVLRIMHGARDFPALLGV